MYQHGSTLMDQGCPSHVLALDMVPRPWHEGEKLSPDAEFFTKLATRPESRVSVTGRVIRTPDQPSPYVFRVESGVYVTTPGG